MTPAFEAAIAGWRDVDPEAGGGLHETRLLAHWAVQPLAAAGHSLGQPHSDEGHTAMMWDGEAERFIGIPTLGCLRTALQLPQLTLQILDAEDETVADLTLVGHDLDEAVAWVGATLSAHAGVESTALPCRPDHELPDHPVGQGEPFPSGDAGELTVLATWFDNAARFFEAIHGGTQGAGPVRCWPHHFDLATLIRLDRDGADRARTIGIGLSPGDERYDEPYFYVSPWPYPRGLKLPPLEGDGVWHTEGFTAAVLPASRLRKQQPAEQVYGFLRSGTAACRALLGGL